MDTSTFSRMTNLIRESLTMTVNGASNDGQLRLFNLIQMTAWCYSRPSSFDWTQKCQVWNWAFWNTSIYYSKLNYYRGYHEMPQKVCGGDILHVTAYAIFPEMPQNRTVSVFLFFLFEIWSRVFFLKCPTTLFVFPKMPQNRIVSVFLFFSLRNLITCFFPEMPHFYFVRFSWNAPFSNQ